MGENHARTPGFEWQADDAHLLAEIIRVAFSQDQLRVLGFCVHAKYPQLPPPERALIRPLMAALAAVIDEEGYDDTGMGRPTMETGLGVDKPDPRPGRAPGPPPQARTSPDRQVVVSLSFLRELVEDPTPEALDLVSRMAWREEEERLPRRRHDRRGQRLPRPLPKRRRTDQG